MQIDNPTLGIAAILINASQLCVYIPVDAWRFQDRKVYIEAFVLWLIKRD